MNCKNCGALIEDSDAKFCFMCGASLSDLKDAGNEEKVARDIPDNIQTPDKDEMSATEEMPHAAPYSAPHAAPYMAPDTAQDTDAEPDVRSEVEGETGKPDVETVAPEKLSPAQMSPAKKSRAPFITFAVLFALITLAAIACEFIQFHNWYMSKCWPRPAVIADTKSWVIYTNLSIFAVASIITMVYSFTKSKMFSAIKGLCILGVLVGEIILEGYSTIKKSVDIIVADSELMDKYIAVMLISSLGIFYIFMFFDIIRSLFSLRKIAVFINFLGYFTALFMGVTSAVLIITEVNVLRLNFLPPMVYIITFTLTLVFAGTSRARIPRR